MLKDIAEAMLGRRPFDLVIRNVQIVNVFSASIVSGSIGIVNGHIAGVFGPEEALDSRRSIDGGNAYALPGFVDSHMHLESSMLTPEHFAQVALSCGTTTVCADPHEIANVLGIEGVRGLTDACRSLPLRVLLTAPSTIPSAPGLEDSGFDVGPAEMEALLDIPGVAGLGEVMDFNAVAAGDERMLSVIEAAANHRDRFGGKGAKAAIVTTEVCNAAARHRAAQLGIAVIDLEELKTGQIVHRLKVIMKAE